MFSSLFTVSKTFIPNSFGLHPANEKKMFNYVSLFAFVDLHLTQTANNLN